MMNLLRKLFADAAQRIIVLRNILENTIKLKILKLLKDFLCIPVDEDFGADDWSPSSLRKGMKMLLLRLELDSLR